MPDVIDTSGAPSTVISSETCRAPATSEACAGQERALELGTLSALPALSLSLIWMSEKAAALLQGEW